MKWRGLGGTLTRPLLCWRGHAVGSVSFLGNGKPILYLDPSALVPRTPGRGIAMSRSGHPSAPARLHDVVCAKCGAGVGWHKKKKARRHYPG